MSELDEILAEHSALASAGAGQFTVDPRRQRELLARLGLQNTAQGFLKLCQGIYRSGTRRVLFRTAKNSLNISFAQGRALPDPIWDTATPMGLALLSLSQDYRVTWEHHQDGVVRGGHLAPDSFVVQEPVPSPHYDTLTTLNISRTEARWWHSDWVPGIRQSLARQLVWNRIEWQWNDQPLIRRDVLSKIATAVVLATPDMPGELADLSDWLCLIQVRDGEDLFPANTPYDRRLLSRPAHAVLGATKHSWSETFFVLDGLLLEGERNLLDRPGVVAVISADGLTPALSGLELVHDAAFRQRLQGLRPEVSWLDSINQRA